MIQRLLASFRGKDRDTKTVLWNVAGAFGIKGIAMVISLLTVPAFIRYFDNNIYLGAWYTVLSVVMWFLTFDFGVGNGMRNRLVRHIIDNNHEGAKRIISSGLLMSLAASAVMMFAGMPVVLTADWNVIFNIPASAIPPDVLRTSLLWLYGAILLRMALVAVNAIFYALQLSSVNNLLALISSILIYLYILFARFDTPAEALRNVSAAYLVLYNLPVVLAAVVVFARRLRQSRPSLRAVGKKEVKDICSLGGNFFYCQILFTILTCSDQFLITRYFGSSYTVDYTFYYRLTSMISMVVALGTTPLWSMITKAMEQGRHEWITRLFVRLRWGGLAIVAIEFLFVPLLQPIMNLWLGKATIDVDYTTATAFALYGSLLILNNLLATFACGLGRLGVQLVWYTAGCAIKLAVILLGRSSYPCWDLVIWADVAAFFPYVAVQYFALRRYFRNLPASAAPCAVQDNKTEE